MINMQFHGLGGMSRDEVAAGNVRTFAGNGTPYLICPGLKAVESVRVGTMNVPLVIEQKVPTDHTLKEFERVKVPLVILAEAPDGTPILLRSVQSNDGLWQDGETIYVGGEWEESPAPLYSMPVMAQEPPVLSPTSAPPVPVPMPEADATPLSDDFPAKKGKG